MYIHFVFSLDSIEQIKRDRRNHLETFVSYTNQIKYCSEELNNLSLKIIEVTKNVSEKKNFCESIHTEKQFQQCLQSKSKSLTDIENLSSAILDIKNHCFSFVKEQFLQERKAQLELSAKSLKESLSHLRDKNLQIVKNKETSAKANTKNKLVECNQSFVKPNIKVSSWYFETERAYKTGNLYTITKGLHALEILNDYTSTLFQICNVENTTLTRLNQHKITNMKNILTNSQRKLETAKNQFSDLTFDQSSGIMCKNLTEENADNLGLCDYPINNSSWIYSMNHLLSK